MNNTSQTSHFIKNTYNFLSFNLVKKNSEICIWFINHTNMDYMRTLQGKVAIKLPGPGHVSHFSESSDPVAPRFLLSYIKQAFTMRSEKLCVGKVETFYGTDSLSHSM